MAKLNPAGSGLVYATFLGGSGDDYGYGIAVDGAGSAYVTGCTDSTDFPTTPGAFDTSFNGGDDAFVAKLAMRAGQRTPRSFQWLCAIRKPPNGIRGQVASCRQVVLSRSCCWRSYLAACQVVILQQATAGGRTPPCAPFCCLLGGSCPGLSHGRFSRTNCPAAHQTPPATRLWRCPTSRRRLRSTGGAHRAVSPKLIHASEPCAICPLRSRRHASPRSATLTPPAAPSMITRAADAGGLWSPPVGPPLPTPKEAPMCTGPVTLLAALVLALCRAPESRRLPTAPPLPARLLMDPPTKPSLPRKPLCFRPASPPCSAASCFYGQDGDERTRKVRNVITGRATSRCPRMLSRLARCGAGCMFTWPSTSGPTICCTSPSIPPMTRTVRRPFCGPYGPRATTRRSSSPICGRIMAR